MTTKGEQQDLNFAHLLCAIGGGLAGAWWVKNQTEQAQLSRAELDDPDLVQEVCEEIAGLLGDWEPDDDFESEGDFVEALASYLEENSDYEIEVEPDTGEGCPDILIAGVLALECKSDPTKSERDRCVGQCAGYSRKWVTWAVLVDSPASSAQAMEHLLADKGLGRILVWNFN